jgi:hypothetical protein
MEPLSVQRHEVQTDKTIIHVVQSGQTTDPVLI